MAETIYVGKSLIVASANPIKSANVTIGTGSFTSNLTSGSLIVTSPLRAPTLPLYTEAATQPSVASGGDEWFSTSNSNLYQYSSGIWNLLVAFPIPALFSFTNYTFLSIVGTQTTTGPILSQCTAAYAGTPWISSYFTMGTYQGYQRWTVPETTSYFLVAAGAAGGYGQGCCPYGGQAYGATISGKFNLTKGDVIEMVIGSTGGDGTNSPHGNERGGGGGTFVLNVTTSTLLMVAGGGGGQPSANYGPSCSRNLSTGHGQAGPVCGGMDPWCYTSVTVPSLGYGGNNAGNNTGGSGGGYLSAGAQGGGHCSVAPGGGGYNNGSVGGTGSSCYSAYSQGGFGGGGNGSLGTPGGAGGYTGGTVTGAWSTYSTWGGGGGSYNAGTARNNEQGANLSTLGGYQTAGYVTITKLPSTPVSYGSSTILTSGALQTAAGTLFPNPTQLLFRASRDGYTAAAFHTACDGFYPIFIVIKANTGYIATAYTSVPFCQKANYTRAPVGTNWLNNLWNGSSTSTSKYYNSSYDSSIYNNYVYGPTFGGGHDLYIPNNFNSTTGYTNTPYNYNVPNNATLFGNYSSWTVTDMEVYYDSTPFSYTASTILNTSTLQNAALTLFPTPSRLLFRASRDGYTAAAFHALCNGYAPLFIVIRANTGYIATAYTSIAYNSDNTYKSAPVNANWLNNLWNGSTTSTSKYYNTSTGSTIYDGSSYGPTFGGGHDLYIPDNFNSNTGYTNPSTYSLPSNTLLFGNYNSWSVSEMEIYI